VIGLTAPQSKQPLSLLQVLRAFAAGTVVVHHASGVGPRQSWYGEWGGGAAGVDIFFIISGFIMAYSSPGIMRNARPGWTFLKRRAERIYPVYWVLTTLKVVIALVVPTVIGIGLGSPTHILSSYLLLPLGPGSAGLLPILVWGWTLMFEMLFYLLYAFALGLSIKPLIIITPVLGVLAGCAFWRQPISMPFSGYVDPIVLEFLYGMVLFEVYVWWQKRDRRLSQLFIWSLLTLGLCLMFVSRNQEFKLLRPFVWGIPALMITMSALLLEQKFGRSVPKLLLQCGNESYALYLTHVFVLSAGATFYSRMHWERGALASTYPLIAISFSYIAAHFVYIYVEQPFIVFFRGKRRAAVESGT
jgi:exopolysaccharide production protein ExoZ